MNLAQIKRRYTRAHRLGTGNYDVVFQVDHQYFNIAPGGFESRREADWMRRQLAIALERMIKQSKGAKK